MDRSTREHALALYGQLLEAWNQQNVRAVVGLKPPGAADLNPAVNAIQSLVITGDGAAAQVALLHNTPAAFRGRPELVEQLTRELTDALHSGQLVTAS